MFLFSRNGIWGIIGLLFLMSISACSNTKNISKIATSESSKEEKSDFESAIEKSTVYEGLFTVYQDTTDGSTKLEIQKDQLDKEFIYFGMSSDGVPEVGHFRGAFRDNKIIKVRKYFDKIEFVHVNNSFYFDDESPLSRAAAANISDAVLFSSKIEVNDEENGRILISADPLFLSESLHQVKPSPNPRSRPGEYSLGQLSSDKSKYAEIRSYPENTDVVVEYVYESPYVRGSTSDAITDGRSVTVQFQHTFIEMPENDYKLRFDDPRVGYFITQKDDQISTSATPFYDLIHRWKLEKKNPDAELSEPVEPIVWWIENTTPTGFRETIKNATLAWNEAFEEAGFKNAIRVKVQPDSADWDAGDIRYNVLRWTSSPEPPFGGYGPSFVNPRTGQILGADIMLEWAAFRAYTRSEDLFTGTFNSSADLNEAMDPRYCNIDQFLSEDRQFAASAILLMDDAGEQDLDGLQKEAMTRLILHEVGHTLGLNHNMQASSIFSPEEIYNPERDDESSLSGSVMDYHSINVNPNRDEQGRYYDLKPGPYDVWAIEYGYSPALNDPEAEQERLEEILSRSTDPELAFGNDADDMRSSGNGIDPRVMIRDMSSDPVGYSVERIELSKHLLDGLVEKYGTREGQSYQELRNAFVSVMGHRGTQTTVISRQIGGVYRDRAFIGQEGGTQPYTPVPAEKQRQAMSYLSEYLFAPDAFEQSHEVYKYLQAQRRGFNFYGDTEDPKVHDLVLGMQISVITHILHPNTMKRLTDSRTYGNTYAAADVVRDLTGAIFDADAQGNVNTFRQNAQVEYVKVLTAVLESDQHDNLAKSAALHNLQYIRGLMEEKDSVNNETMAHAAHVSFLVDEALESES
ncbi:MAG: zinc-dependent metalloprotease [Balneolaceae bacterium]|nr:zinc-dependent metalloprotease [Balneolaceae bacterium]